MCVCCNKRPLPKSMSIQWLCTKRRWDYPSTSHTHHVRKLEAPSGPKNKNNNQKKKTQKKKMVPCFPFNQNDQHDQGKSTEVPKRRLLKCERERCWYHMCDNIWWSCTGSMDSKVRERERESGKKSTRQYRKSVGLCQTVDQTVKSTTCIILAVFFDRRCS